MEYSRRSFIDDEASTVIEYFEAKAEEKYLQKKDVFLTKEDKIDLIKWMVGFWIAQMGAIVGLYILVINSFSHLR